MSYFYIIKITISIHALLAESDSPIDVLAVSAIPISIHALLAESDSSNPVCIVITIIFLSTLSLRRATPFDVIRPAIDVFLSTLSLRRAT